jgi:hypothetical protein
MHSELVVLAFLARWQAGPAPKPTEPGLVMCKFWQPNALAMLPLGIVDTKLRKPDLQFRTSIVVLATRFKFKGGSSRFARTVKHFEHLRRGIRLVGYHCVQQRFEKRKAAALFLLSFYINGRRFVAKVLLEVSNGTH